MKDIHNLYTGNNGDCPYVGTRGAEWHHNYCPVCALGLDMCRDCGEAEGSLDFERCPGK